MKLPFKKQRCPHRDGHMFCCSSPHTADALKRVWQGSSCSPPPSLFHIRTLSLPITPDCIWQMPLLAPYHQVQRRQPKTILLCPYTTSVLHFAWLTHLLLWGSNGAKALSVEQLHESQVSLAGGEVLGSALDTAPSVTANLLQGVNRHKRPSYSPW